MAWGVGQQVGAYRLDDKLGQGGMATVYRGHHIKLERDVAIKVMHPNFLEDDSFLERFKREARIVARLDHPHIVPVYDFDHHDGQPYLVMKYIDGESLKERLDREILSLDEIRHMMDAVGSALHYAHQQGILHRDIKPSNIVIDENNTPYLTDFGLARLAAAGESTMSADVLLGTPNYISPEQARGVKDIDGRTDIYSLGIVLYELLVGQVPYTADTPYAIIHDHIYSPLPDPSTINPEIPGAVEDVLYRSLAKNPDDRYDDVSAMIEDLQRAIEESQLSELDDNRAQTAALSLQQMRNSTMPEQAITSGNLASQQSNASSKQTQSNQISNAANLDQSASRHNQGNAWQIGGCGAFLVISLISAGIILSMSNSILELVSLRQTADYDTALNQRILNAEDRFFERIGVQYDDSPYPHYNIPDTNLTEARLLNDQFSDNGFSYLLVAQALWEDDATAAREFVRQGSDYVTRIDLPIYILSAARIADERDDSQAAITLHLIALELAEDTPELFDAIRPGTGEYLYTHAGEITEGSIRSLEDALDWFNTNNFINATALRNTDGLRFVVARNLIEQEQSRTAALILRSVPEQTRLQSEFDLLKAKTALLIRDYDNARRLANDILERRYACLDSRTGR